MKRRIFTSNGLAIDFEQKNDDLKFHINCRFAFDFGLELPDEFYIYGVQATPEELQSFIGEQRSKVIREHEEKIERRHIAARANYYRKRSMMRYDRYRPRLHTRFMAFYLINYAKK